MRNLSLTRLAVVCLALLLAAPATADRGYSSIPAETSDHAVEGQAPATAKGSGLDLKVVAYDGSVNGELTVEVRNPSKSELEFSAQGLYFVPKGDADQAPQRLGAVGPMQIAEGAQSRRVDKLKVPAGATMKVKLDVFCIDSHRPAPTSKTAFSLGTKRLPAKLRSTIETRAKAAADSEGGYAAPAAKGKMQSEVWRSRDAEWIEIDGEGRQEIGKKAGPSRPVQRRGQR